LNNVSISWSSENEHNFEDDQLHIDEEHSNNVSEYSDEDNNIINEQENKNNQETLPSIFNDLGTAVNTSVVLRSMRCAAHTLQLSILDVFKIESIKSTINKSRRLVKILRLPKNLETLKNMDTLHYYL
jgi:hypothetical protein